MSERTVFNWQIVTVLLALLVQFAGVVWVASRVTLQVEILSSSLSSLQVEYYSDRNKIAPIATNLAYIERDIKEIKEYLAQNRKDAKK